MAGIEKIIIKMKNQPNGMRLQEAETPLKACYIKDILRKIEDIV